MKLSPIVKMPDWIERLAVEALKKYIPVSMISELLDQVKGQIFDHLEALSLQTQTDIDDKIVAAVRDAFDVCQVGSEFLCDLIERGEVAVVDFLRVAAAKTETKIDDVMVEIIAKAFAAAAVPA